MKYFYVALIESNAEVKEAEGKRFVAAMNELKEAGKQIGNVTYYQVKDEQQYRKAEHDFKKQVKG